MTPYAIKSSVVLRAAQRAAFVVIFLFGGIVQFSHATRGRHTHEEPVPAHFTSKLQALRYYLCSSCSVNEEELFFCKQICKHNCKENYVHRACETVHSSSSYSGMCIYNRKTFYCIYEDENDCEFDDTEGCRSYEMSTPVNTNRSCFCARGHGQGQWFQEGWPFERSCSQEGNDMSTTELLTHESLTQEPLTQEPLTQELSTVGVRQTAEPSTAINVTAIVVSSVLSVILLVVIVVTFCIFRTYKLKCGNGSASSADKVFRMKQTASDENRQGHQSMVSTNAYEDMPQHQRASVLTYSPNQDQGPYYSSITNDTGNPGARIGQQEVIPSAPPIEGSVRSTGLQEGHEYFVLEREQQYDEPSQPNATGLTDTLNHDYFVLEKDDLKQAHVPTDTSNHEYFVLEKDFLEKADGNSDGETSENDVDGAISKPAATHVGYDHVERFSHEIITDHTYSHLNPNHGQDYDHIDRSGKP